MQKCVNKTNYDDHDVLMSVPMRERIWLIVMHKNLFEISDSMMNRNKPNDMICRRIMYPKISINLGNLVLSLSDALDLAFSSLAMHQQRTAFIAWQLAKRAKLDGKRIENVFLAGLLHDIGALSIEEKKSLHDCETSDVEPHCIRGKNLFQSNPWLVQCADLVRYHHRDWTMWEESQNSPEVFDSQLLFLADYLERQIDRKTYILHQDETLCNQLKELAGKKIKSEIVDLLLEESHREEFGLTSHRPVFIRCFCTTVHFEPLRSTSPT